MLRTLVLAGTLIAAPALAQERLKPLAPAQYDTSQRAAVAAFEAARKVAPAGPFAVLVRSPELIDPARVMGDYLRFSPAIGVALGEFVTLIAVRELSQDFQWALHAPLVVREGIAQAKVDAIADGRRPDGMTEDEAIVYDFTVELLRSKRVSDPTYERALKRFGERGVVDLALIPGYHSMFGLLMNVARTPAPAGGEGLKRFP